MMPSRTAQRGREPGGSEDGPALAVFGVVPAATTSSALDGGGLAVSLVATDEVAAAVAPTAVERLGRTELLEYHSVLDALAQRGPVVPIRFGTVLPHRAAVVEFLAERHDQLAQALRRLTGRRQFNLRATYVEESVLRDLVVSRPELAALRERTRDVSEDASYADRMKLGELVARALEGRAAADSQALLDRVTPLVANLRVRHECTGMQVLDVAMLVEDDQASRLVDRLEALAAENSEDLRLRLVGPMAAYDFAEDSAWA